MCRTVSNSMLSHGFVEKQAIPERFPLDLIEGFAMDAADHRYSTEEDTLTYCYHVAGAVGVMMAMVMGIRDRPTLLRACDLGIAFQLTNKHDPFFADYLHAGIVTVITRAHARDTAHSARFKFKIDHHRIVKVFAINTSLGSLEVRYFKIDARWIRIHKPAGGVKVMAVHFSQVAI